MRGTKGFLVGKWRLRLHHRAGRYLREQLVLSTDLHMKQNKTKQKTPKNQSPEGLSGSA